MPIDRYRGKRPTKSHSVGERANAKGENTSDLQPDAAENPVTSENAGVRKVKPQQSATKAVAGTGDGSAMDETVQPDRPNDGVGSFDQNGPSLGQSLKNGLGNAASTAGDAARGGVSGIKTAFQNGVSTVTHGTTKVVTTVVGKTAKAIGVSKPVASVLLALTIGLSGGGIGMLAHSFNYEQQMMSQDGIMDDDEDCKTDLSKINAAETAMEPANTDTQMTENAKKLWAVFKALGATDEQAAGALGNFQTESGMDPTIIEGMSGVEPYTLGPKKQNALANIAGYTENLLNKYGSGVNRAFYHTSRYGAACGVGFFQATGSNYDGLVDSAAASGKDKMSLDGQIIYMLTTYGKASWVKGWCGQSMNVADAAVQFLENFEGCSRTASYAHADQRIANAQNWYNQFKGTTGDTAYAQSILAAAQTTGKATLSGVAASTAAKCGDGSGGGDNNNYDNGTLAEAAVAYAWPTEEAGMGNNGTQLYKNLNDAILGLHIYQSCDASISTAVRWCGADEDFVKTYTDTQDSYCREHSAIWENCGPLDDKIAKYGSNISQYLQPGDILLTTSARRTRYSCGHIVMFVGNEAVQKKYPGNNGNLVSGSLGQRSPGIAPFSPSNYQGDGYYIYRYKGNYPGTTWRHIADGKGWSGTHA